MPNKNRQWLSAGNLPPIQRGAGNSKVKGLTGSGTRKYNLYFFCFVRKLIKQEPAYRFNVIMGSNKIKMKDEIVVVKLPNGDKFYMVPFDGGLSICVNKNRKLKFERFSPNDIVIKLK
jgi:hypothetical protein